MQISKENHSHTHTVYSTDIPIIQRLYEFYTLLYQYLKSFPKKDRYTLGQRLEIITLKIMEEFFQIPRSKGPEKILLLKKASAKLDVLKLFVRLAKDTQVVDNKKYLLLEQPLVEIGKMLGGWLKASQEKESSF